MDRRGDSENSSVSWTTVVAGTASVLALGLGYCYYQTKQEELRLNYETHSMAGRTILVTGANTGLGKHTAAMLAKAGGNVIMGCRSLERANLAAAEIQTQLPPGTVNPNGGGEPQKPYDIYHSNVFIGRRRKHYYNGARSCEREVCPQICRRLHQVRDTAARFNMQCWRYFSATVYSPAQCMHHR
jgi:hypothetical protein